LERQVDIFRYSATLSDIVRKIPSSILRIEEGGIFSFLLFHLIIHEKKSRVRKEHALVCFARLMDWPKRTIRRRNQSDSVFLSLSLSLENERRTTLLRTYTCAPLFLALLGFPCRRRAGILSNREARPTTAPITVRHTYPATNRDWQRNLPHTRTYDRENECLETTAREHVTAVWNLATWRAREKRSFALPRKRMPHVCVRAVGMCGGTFIQHARTHTRDSLKLVNRRRRLLRSRIRQSGLTIQRSKENSIYRRDITPLSVPFIRKGFLFPDSVVSPLSPLAACLLLFRKANKV